MIKKFDEFIAEEFKHQQVGARNENWVFADLDELKYDLGEGENGEVSVESLNQDEYNSDKLDDAYIDFVDVYHLVYTSGDVSDDVYVVYGNEKDGYDYETISNEEFAKKYGK